jgi:FHA domain
MPARLVALDEGSDIPLDRAMVVVGRHPQCDARLDSLRVSRHHCCMTVDHGDVIVRDLGSTNGIRINGQRVEFGRLRPNDELAIAHIRYRLDNGQGHEATLADNGGVGGIVARDPLREPALAAVAAPLHRGHAFGGVGVGIEPAVAAVAGIPGENRLAAAVRELLPSNLADRCRIQVIVQVPSDGPDAVGDSSGSDEGHDACPPDSSH